MRGGFWPGVCPCGAGGLAWPQRKSGNKAPDDSKEAITILALFVLRNTPSGSYEDTAPKGE